MSSMDKGATFGTWRDETSRLIYHAAMPALLVGTPRDGTTLDLGGGNGMAREWFHNCTTVDLLEDMGPDVVADLRTYTPLQSYDRVLLRYVLHYLTDGEMRDLFHRLAGWHHGQVTVIQFVNDNLAAKKANSINESKTFRTERKLIQLLRPWKPVHRVAVEYDVVPEFYRNRLGHPDPTGHRERVVALDCEVPRR